MIKIYGSPMSSSGRVFWTALEAEIPYERVPLNMRERQHKSPEYLKLNPNGKVPTLIDGNLVLWESAAITFYLAEKYKPELMGRDQNERGLIYQWSVWAMTELQPPHVDLLIQRVFVPEDKRDQAVIDRSLKAIPPKLEILDSHLSDKTFAVGERFSLADLNLASVVFMNMGVGHDISQFKSIGKWAARIMERPSHQKLISLGR